MNFNNLLGPVVTVILTMVSLYLAHNFRRQMAIHVDEKRLEAYAALWSKMAITSPVRLTTWTAKPLTREERQKLFADFTAWYYDNGHGMLLGNSTRSIYLRVKDNLICPIDCYEPQSIRKKLLQLSGEQQEQARGYLAISHLSLLRTRMKADLTVYGPSYHSVLDDDARALLEFCGEDLSKIPWSVRENSVNGSSKNVEIFAKT